MSMHALGRLRLWRFAPGPDIRRGAGLALLLALIGVELVALVAFLPDTLRAWWNVESVGDFGNFYSKAEGLELNGLYSPALSLLLYPLTFLGITTAYRVYVALGAVAVLGVAYLAQRSVASPEAKLALALGVISIPQMHWALRLGHQTPFLALAALGGFLLLRRAPLLAGLCFAVLVLKPQYAAIPALYLLWTRNGRALAAMLVAALAMELAGFAAVGFGQVGPYIAGIFDLGSDARDYLLPYQQSWQYAWQGFLISLGVEPNPLVAIDLALLSLGAVVVAWMRGSRSVAVAAAAFGMLLVTPYANFYDWALLVVPVALLLRADLPWRPVLPAMAACGLYAALIASQAATPFPAVDLELAIVAADGEVSLLPSSFVFPTDGIYWVTPLTLAVVGALAFVARRAHVETTKGEHPVRASFEPALGPVRRLAGGVALAALLVPAAYFGAAFYSHVEPFAQPYDPFAPSEVLKQLPSDFPLPEDEELASAGPGDPLPYHLEWTSEQPVSEVAGIYRGLLTQATWELMLEEETSPAYRIRLARFTPYGFMTHWAMLDVSPWRTGSRISLELFVTQSLTVTAGGSSGEGP